MIRLRLLWSAEIRSVGPSGSVSRASHHRRAQSADSLQCDGPSDHPTAAWTRQQLRETLGVDRLDAIFADYRTTVAHLPHRFAENPVPKLNRWRTPLQSTSERHVHIVAGTDAHVEERLHSPGAQQVLDVAAACKRHAVTERCHLQGQPHRVEFETRGRGLRVDACRGEPMAPALGKTDCREEGAVPEVRGAS